MRTQDPAESKPALWIQAGIHAREASGRQIVLYFIQRLLESSAAQNSAEIRLLDTRTFYVLPILDVDGGQKAFTRHPAWPGYKQEDHEGRDLDGDGYITTMRVKDPTGTRYPSAVDPGIMLRTRSRNAERSNYISTE